MKIPTWNDDQLLTCSTSTSSSTEPPKRPQQPSVHFAADSELCVVRDVLSRQDYTPQEAEACWYTKNDYKTFKRNSIQTLQLWRAGSLPAGGTSEHCLRGLEGRTREGSQHRKEVKEAARRVVLVEVQRQLLMTEGTFHLDAQALADVYRKTTAPQQHLASVQGMCDQLEAREYSALAQAVQPKPHSLNSGSTNSAALKLQGILDSPSLTLVGGMAA